jgi:predicted small metal-binding protein
MLNANWPFPFNKAQKKLFQVLCPNEHQMFVMADNDKESVRKSIRSVLLKLTILFHIRIEHGQVIARNDILD